MEWRNGAAREDPAMVPASRLRRHAVPLLAPRLAVDTWRSSVSGHPGFVASAVALCTLV